MSPFFDSKNFIVIKGSSYQKQLFLTKHILLEQKISLFHHRNMETVFLHQFPLWLKKTTLNKQHNNKWSDTDS